MARNAEEIGNGIGTHGGLFSIPIPIPIPFAVLKTSIAGYDCP
jgi:hypothetical protein